MTTHLLDLNLLIALAWPTHLHHEAAHQWFAENASAPWATCPITQTGFVRLSSNPKFSPDAVSPGEARALLGKIVALPRHEFWPDDLPVHGAEYPADLVVGHRQVTDAYLLGLARKHGGCLVTFDRRIRALLPDEVDRSRYLGIVRVED